MCDKLVPGPRFSLLSAAPMLACMPGALALAAVLLATGVPHEAEAGRKHRRRASVGYRINPRIPPWVVKADLDGLRVGDLQSDRLAKRPVVDSGAGAKAAPLTGPVRYAMVDVQQRIRTTGVARFFRHVRQVLSPAGMGDVAQLTVDFDPEYEYVVIHHARVLRGDRLIDALGSSELRLAQREKDLERQLYDGTKTLVAFIGDVRVGDFVDFAYSIRGNNPALGSHYVAGVSLGYSVPVERLRARIMWQVPGVSPRVAVFGTPQQPTQSHAENGSLITWERINVAATHPEDDVPADVDTYPWMQLSDFGSWSEVVAWALPMYVDTRDDGEGLREVIDALRQHETKRERALAAIRFVQDDIRYQGLEAGVRSLLPHHPNTVVRRRFGDCKDKARLLMVLLSRLGIDAAPAMVHTTGGASLPKRLPSPWAFNHVIVRLVLDGAVYWVDGTRASQARPLEAPEQQNFAHALVIRPTAESLEVVPRPTLHRPSTHVQESFDVSADGSASLDVETVYRGDAAKRQRDRIAASSLEELGYEYLSFYERRHPGIESAAQLRVRNDDIGGELTVYERYRIPSFWSGDGSRVSVDAWLLAEYLGAQPGPGRSLPLSVPYPLNVQHTIEVRARERFNIKPVDTERRGPALALHVSVEPNDRVVRLDYRLNAISDRVGVEELREHVDMTRWGGSQTTYHFWNEEQTNIPASAVGGLGLAFVLAGLLRPLNRKWRGVRRSRSRPRPATGLFPSPGSVPSSPMAVEGEAQARQLLSELPCGCGQAEAGRSALAICLDDISYGGQRLWAGESACGSCGTRHVRYLQRGCTGEAAPPAPSDASLPSAPRASGSSDVVAEPGRHGAATSASTRPQAMGLTKLVLFGVMTLGSYAIYWFYVQARSLGLNRLSSAVVAALSMVSSFWLFGRLRCAETAAVKLQWLPLLCATMLLIVHAGTYFFPAGYGWLNALIVLPLLPIQFGVNRRQGSVVAQGKGSSALLLLYGANRVEAIEAGLVLLMAAVVWF